MLVNIREYDLRKQGEAIGFDKGRKDGLTEGLHQGALQTKLETAAAFKRLGVALDTIAAGTGLSREEIEKL